MRQRCWILLGVSSLLLWYGILLLPVANAQSTSKTTAPTDSLAPSGSDALEINPMAPVNPGVVLVGLKSGITMTPSRAQSSSSSLNTVFNQIGVRQVQAVFPNIRNPRAPTSVRGMVDLNRIFKLRLSPNANLEETLRKLRSDPGVAYAEPDYQAHVASTPNDPEYASQWGLVNINAAAAWDTTTGSSDVVIAIIDSGMDSTHPDLSSKLWTNPGETAGNGVDDDSDGLVDDIYGWNLVGGNTDLSDNTGHGTQVAGIAAAASNNGTGITGVCWSCRLMIVKVVQSGGVANYSDIAAGVAYAAQKGAKVINISLGGASDSITLKTAIATAAQTAVIVGGAGNDGNSKLFYPAAYDDYVLAVAGTRVDDMKVDTSNYGSWVDVSAPGESIQTTANGGSYSSSSGTSLAAPFASGLAGLVLSQNSSWSPIQVRSQIIQTTDEIDSYNPGYEGHLGSGRINAYGSVTAVPSSVLRYVSYAVDGVSDGSLKVGSTSLLTVTLRNNLKDASSVAATLSTTSGHVTITDANGSWGAIASGQSVANSFNTFQVSVLTNRYGLSIPFTLNVVADGVSSSLTFTATTESAVITVGGSLVGNTTWTKNRSYLVTSNVIVPAGVTLTIQPGTVIKFNAGKALVVNGTLIADGTVTSPVRFTSAAANPAPGDWGTGYNGFNGGIIFGSTSQPAVFDSSGNYQSGSIVRNSTIEYSKGLSLDNAAPFIDHNLIWKNGATGGLVAAIYYNGYAGSSHPVISHNRIVQNTMTAVGTFNGYFVLRQNVIADNVAFGSPIDLHTGYSSLHTQTVISNTITGNSTSSGYCGSASIASLVCVSALSGAVIELKHNNIYANQTEYDVALKEDPGQVLNGTGNYWGTNAQPTIVSRLYDNYGRFDFDPFDSGPETTAPPFLYQVSLSPTSPVGIQQVTLNLTFSAPMDPGADPTVSFGATSPYTSFVVLDNAKWTDSTHWRATYDVTSLVSRGTYTVSVSSAKGTDGMEAPTDTRFGFTVDYAGEITDQTAPTVGFVFATGKPSDPSLVQGMWSASDTESTITCYRYAIGTAEGATDIVGWTTTTSNTFSRAGLGLVTGRQYWLSVQAKNAGGLWSASTNKAFVSGVQSAVPVYLPLLKR